MCYCQQYHCAGDCSPGDAPQGSRSSKKAAYEDPQIVAARRKPLMIWAAVEISHVPQDQRDAIVYGRALGIVHTNGRDSVQQKQAKLIISKSRRLSLGKIALIEFEKLDLKNKASAVSAELRYVLSMGGISDQDLAAFFGQLESQSAKGQ
jgi:hypothetical protein